MPTSDRIFAAGYDCVSGCDIVFWWLRGAILMCDTDIVPRTDRPTGTPDTESDGAPALPR
jgi:hypothetical protein